MHFDSIQRYSVDFSAILLVSWLTYLRQEFLEELERSGEWEKGILVDEIALLAIYGPIIKHEVEEFIETWNQHRISKQNKRRPWVVPRRPWLLYHHPEAAPHSNGLDYGRKVNLSNLIALRAEADKGPGMF